MSYIGTIVVFGKEEKYGVYPAKRDGQYYRCPICDILYNDEEKAMTCCVDGAGIARHPSLRRKGKQGNVWVVATDASLEIREQIEAEKEHRR